MKLNPDFSDIVEALLEEGAEFLVVGAYAMAAHGVPRATGDIDLWVRPDADNARRVYRALARFGAPLEVLGIDLGDLESADLVVQIGQPPRRIDLLTSVDGLDFESSWARRHVVEVDDLAVPCLSLEALKVNKRSAGREKDLLDLRLLEERHEQS